MAATGEGDGVLREGVSIAILQSEGDLADMAKLVVPGFSTLNERCPLLPARMAISAGGRRHQRGGDGRGRVEQDERVELGEMLRHLTGRAHLGECDEARDLIGMKPGALDDVGDARPVADEDGIRRRAGLMQAQRRDLVDHGAQGRIERQGCEGCGGRGAGLGAGHVDGAFCDGGRAEFPGCLVPFLTVPLSSALPLRAWSPHLGLARFRDHALGLHPAQEADLALPG